MAETAKKEQSEAFLLQKFGHTTINTNVHAHGGDDRAMSIIMVKSVANWVIEKDIYGILKGKATPDGRTGIPEVRIFMQVADRSAVVKRVEFGMAPMKYVGPHLGGYSPTECVVVTVFDMANKQGLPDAIYVITPKTIAERAKAHESNK